MGKPITDISLPPPDDYTPIDLWRDFQAVWDSREGKRVLSYIMLDAGLFESFYTPSSPMSSDGVPADRDESMRRIGMREVALMIKQQLESDAPHPSELRQPEER